METLFRLLYDEIRNAPAQPKSAVRAAEMTDVGVKGIDFSAFETAAIFRDDAHAAHSFHMIAFRGGLFYTGEKRQTGGCVVWRCAIQKTAEF